MPLQRKHISAENALVRLETLCARSEHCEWELREKLRNWNVSFSDADAIIESLARNRFFDNRRFASAYVRDKLRYSHWGRRKIAMGLYAKRIGRDIIGDALDEIDGGEYDDILLALTKAKARSISEGNTYEGRTKLYRSVVSRGFEPQKVLDIIRAAQVWDD